MDIADCKSAGINALRALRARHPGRHLHTSLSVKLPPFAADLKLPFGSLSHTTVPLGLRMYLYSMVRVSGTTTVTSQTVRSVRRASSAGHNAPVQIGYSAFERAMAFSGDQLASSSTLPVT